MTKKEFIKRAMEARKEPTQAELTIRALEEYKFQFYESPRLNWPDNEFRNRCAAIWAIDELITRIRMRQSADPWDVAELFLFELLGLMNETNDEERQKIFRSASFTMEEIVDYMHCMF